MENNLPPQLTLDQLKQSITKLQAGGLSNVKVQEFVNNYENVGGNFVLKQQKPVQPEKKGTFQTSTEGGLMQKKLSPSSNASAEGIADFTGGKEIAQGLGQALTMGKNARGLEDAQNSAIELQTKLLERIKENKALGKDTTRLEAALEDLGSNIQQIGNQTEDVLNPNEITDKQVAGDIVKSAAYLFPFGKVAGALGGAVGSKVAGNIGSGALGGYVADIGVGLTDKEKTVGEAFTPGLGTTIGAAIPGAAPVLRVGGRAIAKAGSKIVETAIPNSIREAGILQTYRANNPFLKRVADVLKGTENAPTTAGKTAVTTKAGQSVNGLFGTKAQIGVQAKRATTSLWNDVISPRLKASDKVVDLDGFFSKVEADIKVNNPELSRQKALLEALEAVKEDYSGVKIVSLEKLQKLKEGWAELVPDKAYKGKPIAGAFREVQKELAGEARKTIYTELGDDVKQAYLDYGNLQGLQEMGKTAMTGSKLKGGAGSFLSEIVSQAITPVATIGGQAIYRLGNGIEFIGKLGAKNIGQALGLKFPGDSAVDAIKEGVEQFKAIPNKQAGFLDIGALSNQTKSVTDNIIKEARKYKSAEDFIKAQPKTYHVTYKKNAKSIEKNGLWAQESNSGEDGAYVFKDRFDAEDFLEEFYGNRGTIIELPTPKSIYNKFEPNPFGDDDGVSAVRSLIDIPSKSQLMEIYNNVVKKSVKKN